MKRSERAGCHTNEAFSLRDGRATDRDECGAPVTSAINRSLLASTVLKPATVGILVTDSRPRRRRAQNLAFCEAHEVIGEGGELMTSDEDDIDDDDTSELAEPAEVLSPEERAFENLTRRNTDFNSISSNLSGTSKTLLDWVDENDKTTERSALTGRHKKFTPLVSVAPFSTGRGPGTVKVNLVAPMQNGEVVKPHHFMQREMVEKTQTEFAKQSLSAGEQVTRLDDDMTRSDGKKRDKVTNLDDSPSSSEEEEKSSTKKGETFLKHQMIESFNTKSKKRDPILPSSKKSISVESTVSSSKERKDYSVSQCLEGPKEHRSEHNEARPSLTGSHSEGISSISAIKSILAEKAAAHKGGVKKRSHAQLQERNRARLNSLDGVYRRSKGKAAGQDKSKTSLSDIPSTELPDSNTPAVPSSDKDTAAPSHGVSKNSKNVTRETSSDRLYNAADSRVGLPAIDKAPELSTPPNDQEELVDAHLRGESVPLVREGNVSRVKSEESSEISAEMHLVGHPYDAVLGCVSHEKVEKSEDQHVHELSNITMHSAPDSKRKNESEPKFSKATYSIGDEMRYRSDSYDINKPKPITYSPRSGAHGREIETKQQRAIKREQELEKKREELERRNRDEKRAQQREVRGTNTSQKKSSSPKREPHRNRHRRDAPQPEGGSPPSHADAASHHIKSETRSHLVHTGAQDTYIRPLYPAVKRAHEMPHSVRSGRCGARSSTSTDSTDDEDDVLVIPQRTMSVSPRSRKRGSRMGVSFAADTEPVGNGGGAKRRSQSVPRPGVMDTSVMNDGEVRRRLVGGGANERRSRRDEPRSRGRFSLKKLLKFGRDDKRRDKDLVFGEFRAKPEIIHPIDRAGEGRVEVVVRTTEQRRRAGEEYRRPMQKCDPCRVESPPSGQVVAGKSVDGGNDHSSATSRRPSTGLTPEGRPKPPPPPPPTGDGSRPAQAPPTRPPPPNPHLVARSQDSRMRAQPDTDYANLGVSRADLAPKKPDRHRDRALPEGADADASADRGHSDVTAQRAQPAAAAEPAAAERLRARAQPARLSLRLRQAAASRAACAQPPPAATSDTLQASFDAVLASNLHALRQILNQVTHLPPASEKQMSLRSLPKTPLLSQFEVAPASRHSIGANHTLYTADHATAGSVVLLVVKVDDVESSDAGEVAPPLTVPPIVTFRDTIPVGMVNAESATETGGELDVTVYALGACRAETLGTLLVSTPSSAWQDDERAGWLLLLQTVWQLHAGQQRGLSAVDESLHQLLVLHSSGDPHCRLVALTAAVDSGGAPQAALSPCQAALCVLLHMLGVPAAAARARDGRAVSSVPDELPSSSRWELLASLLQRDDQCSLRRAQRVLELSLWAPDGLAAEEEAAQWLHRERAALLGAVVRTQPRTIAEQLQLAFLVTADPAAVVDAAQLINI